MNILITGWSGFIGKATAKRLDAAAIKWTPFAGDVLNPMDFEKFGDCNGLIHLAGITRTGPSYDDQKRLIDVNVLGTLNAIDYALRGGMRIIFMSSCCYGNTSNLPIPENEPISYHDAYSYSKWTAEHAISTWHQLFGLEGVIFRGFNVYGPEQPTGFLIPDIVDMIRKGHLEIQNLDSVRDFIYINDLAELIYRAVTTPVKGLICVNAGSGSGHSVKDVLHVIFELLGRNLPVKNQNKPAFIKKSIADVSYAERLFGWHHKTGLGEGIRQILQNTRLLS